MLSKLLNGISSGSIQKIGFDDVLFCMEHPENHILINTLPSNQQNSLIKGTLCFEKEEDTVNSIIENGEMNRYIFVIYGKNTTDETIERKYRQLKSFGIANVYVYCGGLFEWFLLRETFGKEMFKMERDENTNEMTDLLQWKPARVFTD